MSRRREPTCRTHQHPPANNQKYLLYREKSERSTVQHDREVPIPFGPYLAGGGIAALFFGEPLTHLWMPPL